MPSGRADELLSIVLDEIRLGRGTLEEPVTHLRGVNLHRVGRNQVWRIELESGEIYFAKKWTNSTAFAREVYGYRLAERVAKSDARFLAAKLVDVDPDSGIFVTTGIAGRPVSDLLREGLRADKNPFKARPAVEMVRHSIRLLTEWLLAFHDLNDYSTELPHDHTPSGVMARIDRKLEQRVGADKIGDLIDSSSQLGPPPTAEDCGLIFGDATPGNFIFDDGRLGPVDFEDFGVGPIQRDYTVLRDSLRRAMSKPYYYSDRSILRLVPAPSERRVEEVFELELSLLRFEQLHKSSGLIEQLDRRREKSRIRDLYQRLRMNP